MRALAVVRALAAQAFLVCVALAWLGPSARADETLRIGRNGGPSAHFADASEEVLKAAYAKLGVVPRFEEYPLLRSLILADNGALDGDLIRIAEASERYTNLIRVEVPINFLDITSYSRAPCPSFSGWPDLRGKRVAYIRGVLAVERRLQGMTPVPVESMNELFRVLERGMVDVAKVPSEKGPPRKVYSLNASGSGYLDEFWTSWSFLAERIEQLHHNKQPQEKGE